jgi:hypothetical protein
MRHKSLFLFPLILLSLSLCSFAQLWSGVLDPSRAINWSQAGVVGGIPNRTTICATLNPGATAAQINSAITSCPNGQVVSLNAGIYNLSAGVVFDNKSNVTLRGAGPDQTFLVFTGSNPCIGLGGADVCLMNASPDAGGDGNYNNGAAWTAGYAVGTTSITLGAIQKGSIANLQVGSMLFLDQADDGNDPGGVYVCQAQGTCATDIPVRNGRAGRGQVQPVIVTSISGSGPWTIGITPGVRMPNIRSGQSPGAWWDNGLPISGDGIESMSLNHTSTTATGAGIFMMNATGNWVKAVRDYSTASSGIHKHVWFYQSTHNTVRDSYFYGGGDAGNESYGVDTYAGADNLTENSIFQRMATPMIHEGCIGCVSAYNYAVDDFFWGNSGTAPDWQQGSNYHHSVGDAFILFEGNEGIGLTADNVHGTSNFITAFRNYWNGRDTAITLGVPKTQQTVPILLYTHSRYYNVIGNVLGTPGYHTNYTSSPTSSGNCETSIYALGWGGNCGSGSLANDGLTQTSLMRWGNYDTVNAAVRFAGSEVPSGLSQHANPVPASQSLPSSFYLSAKPSWWGSTPWPPIGPDVTGGNIASLGGHAYRIPAGNCYLSVMGGSVTGGIGVLNFNATNCYGGGGGTTQAPAAPTGLTAIVQ